LRLITTSPRFLLLRIISSFKVVIFYNLPFYLTLMKNITINVLTIGGAGQRTRKINKANRQHLH